MARTLEHSLHRAESARGALFSSFTTVVDLDPARLLEEASGPRLAFQCASCSFTAFLRGIERVNTFDGLAAISATFRELPRLVTAFKHGDTAAIEQVAREIGMSRCYEIVPPEFAPSTTLPRVYAVRDAAQLPRILGERDYLLVPLKSALAESHEFAALLARAPKNVLVGYLEHARAIEEFADAVEGRSDEDFVRLVHALLVHGVARTGFIAAVTPCASLRWAKNAKLEALRARLDLSFRRMDADASLMCPENVSGYALSNDLARVPARLFPQVDTRAVRVDRLLLVVAS